MADAPMKRCSCEQGFCGIAAGWGSLGTGWYCARDLNARAAHVDFYEREFYPLSNFSSFRLEYVA
jgi:hypothetical protein